MTTTVAPTKEYEQAFKHFNDVCRAYQPDGAYSQDPKVRYAFVRCRHHLGSGLYQPYLAIRAIRKGDGKELYTKPCSIIRFQDGTASVWWFGGKSKIFASDTANLPEGYR
jgi:hypothetical protein